MPGFKFILSFLTLIFVLSSFSQPVFQEQDKSKKNTDKIEWLTMEEAAARSKKKPRKIFIDVYTDWCGWCKKMDKTTFSETEIINYINKNYYAVKLNAEGKEPITLNGKTYTFKPEYRSHELAIELLQGQMSYPTTVYLDEKFNLLAPVPGYLSASDLGNILKYYAGDHQKHMTFDEFLKLPKS
jgi:thioredoxin-related protein